MLQLWSRRLFSPFHKDEKGGADDVVVKLLLIFIAAVIIIVLLVYTRDDLFEQVKNKISELLGT
jgi:hypothetical protein